MYIHYPSFTHRINLILLILLILISISACDIKSAGKPDIVLITLDTTRWDYLHSYGYELPNTPNLDKLAKMGSRYLNATTVAGTTFPAHASMLTGLYPRSHGARSNFFGLNSGVDTVAKILSAHDYQTGSFVSFKGMHRLGHLDRGFDTASDRIGRREIKAPFARARKHWRSPMNGWQQHPPNHLYFYGGTYLNPMGPMTQAPGLKKVLLITPVLLKLVSVCSKYKMGGDRASALTTCPPCGICMPVRLHWQTSISVI